MTDEKHDPDGFTAALIGAMGTLWVGFSASANAAGHVVLLVLAVIAGAIVLYLRPSWGSVFALGLALYALVLGPVLHFAIRTGWDVALASDPCSLLSGFDPSALFCLFALPVLANVGFASFAGARFLVRRAQFLAFGLRVGNMAMLAVTMVLAGWAIPKALQKPAPERYIESLPVLGIVPPSTGEPSRTLEKRDSMPSSYMLHKTQVYEFSLTPDIVARTYCSDFAACRLLLRSAHSPADKEDNKFSRPPSFGTGQTVFGDRDAGYVDIDTTAPIVVRADVVHGLLFLDGTTPRAVDRQTFQFRGVMIRDVLDTTSSPRGWIVVAIVGVFVASILEIFRVRTRRTLARIANAPTGMLGADGWLVLDDGSRLLRIGLGAGISPGPVVVLFADASIGSRGPYRGESDPKNLEMLPGTQAEVLRRTRWMMQSPIDALAIAVLVLAAAPLATFWCV